MLWVRPYQPINSVQQTPCTPLSRFLLLIFLHFLVILTPNAFLTLIQDYTALFSSFPELNTFLELARHTARRYIAFLRVAE